jgi:hypothetical protein
MPPMTITVARNSPLPPREAFTVLRRAIEDQTESRAHDIVWEDLGARGEYMGMTIEFRVVPAVAGEAGSEAKVMISGPGFFLRPLKGTIEKEIGGFVDKAFGQRKEVIRHQ